MLLIDLNKYMQFFSDVVCITMGLVDWEQRGAPRP